MDVKYINPFINASMEVFSTFAGMPANPGPPVVRTRVLADKEINGFIGLNGHGISGYFIINFSATFLKQILVRLFEHPSSSVEELFDLAGELTNMITGAAKAELSKRGFFFDVAVPKISRTAPAIPGELARNPVIVVPFDTPAGTFHIEASIQRIEEDFQQDTLPEVAPPEGHISVAAFAQRTRMDPVKVKRFLKTGFLCGKKITGQQWHIPEDELLKIQGYRPPKPPRTDPEPPVVLEETMSVEEFARLSGLKPAKIKSFLRSGFLKGIMDLDKVWRVDRSQISKFRKNG